MNIITHRGLDPSRPNYFAESSREAFMDQLSRGYGLEFDLRLTKDDQIVIIHDANLKRATAGRDERDIRDVELTELLSMDLNGSHLASFPELLSLIETTQVPGAVSALHLKHGFQESHSLDVMLEMLKDINADKFIIFDVKVESAQYIKERDPRLVLAPSVAHPYDITRYNGAVGETLYSVEEAIAHRDLFDWVWGDEWDTADVYGGKKQFYTRENFSRFRDAGMKIALVTPELHASSPGLLGGEAHEDAKDHETLIARIQEILDLSPDAVCTDYPDEVRALA